MLKERLHWYFHAISNCILHPLSCYIPYKYCFLVFPCAFRFFGVLSGFLVLFGIYMDRNITAFYKLKIIVYLMVPCTYLVPTS